MGIEPYLIGNPGPPLATGWREELDAALPDLRSLSHHLGWVISQGLRPVITAGRCAASLATLPVICRNFPNAIVVWLDAHADSNVPESSGTGYLGGLVLTGASGSWTTGLGGELMLSNVVLVGSRDLDPHEQDLVQRGALKLVPPGKNLLNELCAAVGDHSVYIHLDCDVLLPGLVPSEYQVEGGLSFAELRDVFEMLANGDVLGLEIAEYEAAETLNFVQDHDQSLMEAITPILHIFETQSSPVDRMANLM